MTLRGRCRHADVVFAACFHKDLPQKCHRGRRGSTYVFLAIENSWYCHPSRMNLPVFPFRAVLFRKNCRMCLANRMNAVLYPFREGYTLKHGKNPARNGRQGVTAVSRKHLRRNTGNTFLETDSTASYEFRAGEALGVSAENHS